MGAEHENFKYYTPTSLEAHGVTSQSEEIGQQTINFKGIRKLTGNILESYSKNDITVFHNGDPLESARTTDKKRFEGEMGRVVAGKCHDMFTKDGRLRQESVQEWNNVIEIAPKIHNAFLNRENYIDNISREQSVNLAAFAIDVARNPELLGETVLNTGFGGSDDEFTSTRLPAYTLPALKIARDLKDIYRERENSVIYAFMEEKLFRQFSGGRMKNEVKNKDERVKIYNEITEVLHANPDNLDENMMEMRQDAVPTNEELTSLRKEYSIAMKMPKVRFFFASNTAMAINHTMEPEGIRKRSDKNISVINEYIDQNFSDVAEQTEVIEDLPWNKHTPYGKVMIEYLTHLLRTSENVSIQKTLKNMERYGGNHGGEAGMQRAGEYAAAHPLLFQDRLDLPWMQYLEGVRANPKVNIIIGGRTERGFSALRNELSERASSEGLKGFILEKISDTQDDNEASILKSLNDRIERWESIVAKRRDNYKDYHSQVCRPDKPYQSIQLITSIGKLPTYYYREGFDQPYRSTNVAYQLQQITHPFGAIDAQHKMPRLKEKDSMRIFKETENIALKEAAVTAERVVFDLEALRKEELRSN
jgi:hypothetical protein